MAQQVYLKEGLTRYETLIKRADGASSWPAGPDPNQIVNGDALKDYDRNRPGPPGGPQTEPYPSSPDGDRPRRRAGYVRHRHSRSRVRRAQESICSDFPDHGAKRWAKFLEKIKTTQTVALQLWLKRDPTAWLADPRTALTGFERPAGRVALRAVDVVGRQHPTVGSRRQAAIRQKPRLFLRGLSGCRIHSRAGSDPEFPPREGAGEECNRSLDERASRRAVAESCLLRSASLLLGFAGGARGRAWAEAPLLSVSAGQYRPVRAIRPLGSGQRAASALAGRLGNRQPLPRRGLGSLRRECGVHRGGRHCRSHGGESNYGGRHEHTRRRKFQHFPPPHWGPPRSSTSSTN